VWVLWDVGDTGEAPEEAEVWEGEGALHGVLFAHTHDGMLPARSPLVLFDTEGEVPEGEVVTTATPDVEGGRL